MIRLFQTDVNGLLQRKTIIERREEGKRQAVTLILTGKIKQRPIAASQDKEFIAFSVTPLRRTNGKQKAKRKRIDVKRPGSSHRQKALFFQNSEKLIAAALAKALGNRFLAQFHRIFYTNCGGVCLHG